MFMTIVGVIVFIFILICMWSVFEIYIEKRKVSGSNYHSNPVFQNTDEAR
jgi:uncharacterized membrane protein